MQDHIINDQIADLARAMLELDNMDEAYRFFEDIFTIHELQAVAQRLALVAGVDAEAASGGWDVPLANLRIHVSQDAAAAAPTLSTLTLENKDGAHYTLDTGL